MKARYAAETPLGCIGQPEDIAATVAFLAREGAAALVGQVVQPNGGGATDSDRATFFVPGVTAERWPGTVEEILQSGHEVALHGYSHRVLPGMSESEQSRGLEALDNLGVEPRGYRAPYWRMTRATFQR